MNSATTPPSGAARRGRLALGITAAREFGLGWTSRRLFYELQRRSGLHQLRFRRREWDPAEAARWLGNGAPAEPEEFHRFWLEHLRPFFFDPDGRGAFEPHLNRIMGEAGRTALLEAADGMGRGTFPYYSAQRAELGFPPRWHQNALERGEASPADHWVRMPMWARGYGDMKDVWEPGRFSAAYTLARAYWATGDERYPETFWRLVESWYEQNPPNGSAHWKCGQETALRLMAWCFALYAFAHSAATTPQRLWILLGAVAAQADRIDRDHLYSELQRNNHSISEGVGLWTVGLLFPWLARAERWRRRGREILERQGRLLVRSDGSFVQKSANYHRLMLHDYIYAFRVGAANDERFSEGLETLMRAAADFIYGVHDPASGGVPNFGGNDGALILPLNSCDYRDFRPVCAASRYLCRGEAGVEPGPWTEDLLWLFGPDAVPDRSEAGDPPEIAASEGGYYTSRGAESWAFFRCGPHRDRPVHADMLHLDVWWRGLNIARDAGTFRYYDPDPWNNSLTATAVHNTVTVDGLDQMDRGPRFLWSNWSQGRLLRRAREHDGFFGLLDGEHDGYTRLPDPVMHRRAVLRAGDVWVVVDELSGEGEHRCTLQWLLEDFPFSPDPVRRRVTLDTPQGGYALTVLVPEHPGASPLDVVRGTEASAPRGWVSEYYTVRRPCVSARCTAEGRLPVRFVTMLAPASWEAGDASGREFTARSGEQRLVVSLGEPGDEQLVARAEHVSPAGRRALEVAAVPFASGDGEGRSS